LVRALDYLGEQKLLEVRSAGLRHTYRWLRRPQDPGALARNLHQRTLDREAREVARLDQVLELAGLDGCQTGFLSAHFGEPLAAPCGHCSWCLNGQKPMTVPAPPPAAVPERVWEQALDVRQKERALLGEPRAFARFLTGLTSPRLTRGKLGKHPLFGALADVPFAAVLRKAEE
jgi:ATP-dependent DNA helicase RecQ